MTEDVWIRPEKENMAEETRLPAWTRVFAYTAVVVSAQLLRWSLYVAHGVDLGYYQQALAALARFGPQAISSYTGSSILLHSDAWLLMVLAYPSQIFGTGFLLLTESFLIGLGYLPLMRIAKTMGLPANLSAFVGALYLLSPLVWAGNLYDFHMSMLAVPFILFAMASLMEKRYAWYLIFMVLLTGFGSKAAVAVLFVALIATFRREGGWNVGLLSLVGALLWTLAVVHPNDLNKLGWVSWPLAHHIGLRVVAYGAWVLAPFALLVAAAAVYGRRVPWSPYWIFGLLYLAGNILSTSPASTSPFDQKSALMVPFFLFALLDTMRRHPLAWTHKVRLGGMAVVAMMLVVMSADFYHSAWRVRPDNGAALESAMATVHTHYPVYAQNNVLPHLGFVTNQVPLSRLRPQHLTAHSEIIWDTQFNDRTTPGYIYQDLAKWAADPRQCRVIYNKGGVKVLEILGADHQD